MKRLFLRRRVLILGAGAVLALALGGCATAFTGGGWIISTSGPGQNANFGFTYKVTDPTTGAGKMSGSYTDRDSSGNPYLKISFQDAPSDVCYGGSGTSCNGLISDYCGGDPTCIAFLQQIVGFGRCVETNFTY